MKRTMAKLLCVVLTAGMLSGASVNVYAEAGSPGFGAYDEDNHNGEDGKEEADAAEENGSETGGTEGNGTEGSGAGDNGTEGDGAENGGAEDNASGNNGTRDDEIKDDGTEDDETEDGEIEDGGIENGELGDNEADGDDLPTDEEDAILLEEDIMAVDAEGQIVPFAEEHKHNNITFEPWTSADSLPDAAGSYYLTGNVTLSAKWEVPTGEVRLCLNGKTIALAETLGVSDCVISVGADSRFSLYDCAGGGKITGGTNGGIRNDGSFTMYGGEISGNSSSGSGGGLYISLDSTFEMHGGKISNNSVRREDGRRVYGGGICNGGWFNLFEGDISDNVSEGWGGGIYNLGTLIMSGGTIQENTSFFGGVGVCNTGTFEMRDGKILNNHERHDGDSDQGCIGGGVHNEGIFELFQGEITGNTAEMGGGVENYHTFTMNGGKIEGNRATDGNGGGVENYGTCMIYGGRVADNSSSKNGGGVFNWRTLKLYDCEICDNTAEWFGGGVGHGVANNVMANTMLGGSVKIFGNKKVSLDDNLGLLYEYPDAPGKSTTISIDGNSPLTQDAYIGVTVECYHSLTEGSTIPVSGANAVDFSDHFHSDNPSYIVQNGTDNAVLLYIPLPHTHQWSPDWTNQETHHWHDCTVSGCDITNNADKDGYGVHTEDGGTVTKQPTETEEGVKTYRCSVCGYEMRTETIDRLPLSHTHQWTDTYDHNETHHWHDCTVTGCPVTDNADKDGYGVHTEDGGTVTKPATETEEGVRTYYCSICGAEIRREAIPVITTGDVEKPDPDDGNKPEPDKGGTPETDGGNTPEPDQGADHTQTDDLEAVNVDDHATELAEENDTPDEIDMPDEPVTAPSQPQDTEPKTGGAVPVELYATLAMISGLTYLLLYFTDHSGGMTEETKKELVSRLIRWAKHGRTAHGRMIRRYLALAAIFGLLVWYHSIGKQNAIGWKEAC